MTTITDKLAQEAKSAHLVLLGPGRDRAHRRYRFLACGHEQEVATTAVRRARLRCQQCLDQKIASEAAAAGLAILGPGHCSDYRRYRFIACGHEQEAQITHVRARNVRCHDCIKQKQSKEATAADVDLVGPGSTAHTRLYRFRQCGHDQDLHVSAVRDHRVRCRICFSKQLADEAKVAGLVLLGPGHNSASRRYRFFECGHESEFAVSNVRRKSVRCQVCIDHRIETDAKKEGLAVVGPGASAQYRRYRFLACGHERELTVGSVHRGDVRCQACLEAGFASDAAREGLTVVGKGKRAAYRLYRCNKCGDEREMSPGAIRRGHVQCKVCLERLLQSEAGSHGLTMLGRGRDANYRRYRFLACGHERDLQPSLVRRGAFSCTECFELSLAAQAKANGVEVVGTGRRTGYRRYRFIACGHEQEMQPAHVRVDGFHCQICNDSAWQGDGNVYVVQLTLGDEEIFKVGLAKSVIGRVTRYGLKDDVTIDILSTYSFPKYHVAHAKEQELQARLTKAGYGISKHDARRFLTSGFTECFKAVPANVLDAVVNAPY